MLDVVPAQLRVRVIRRPRYGCRACEGSVAQAPAPERPIDGGMATEALLAQVLVSKFADHLPLYRQSRIFARQGVELDRSTLCNWARLAKVPPAQPVECQTRADAPAGGWSRCMSWS